MSKFEKQKTVYDQDWQNFRYQDQLRWSRFKTISLIEGAFLFAAYKNQLDKYEVLAVVVLGTLLVAIVSLLAVKDEFDARIHIDRTAEIEKKWGVEKLNNYNGPPWLRGKYLMRSGLATINIFNYLTLIIHIVNL